MFGSFLGAHELVGAQAGEAVGEGVEVGLVGAGQCSSDTVIVEPASVLGDGGDVFRTGSLVRGSRVESGVDFLEACLEGNEGLLWLKCHSVENGL